MLACVFKSIGSAARSACPGSATQTHDIYLAPCPLANGVQMASHNAMNDYESTLKILSILDRSKPIALVTISQSTGIKYADIIRFCTPLIHADVIKRVVDSGNIFYTLLTDEYEAKVAEICNVAPPDDDDEIIDKRPRDSREAIMIRRAMRASGVQEKVSRAGNASADNESIKKKSPERLSAYDLYAMKRSSPSFARPSELTRSSQQLPSVRSSAANPAQSRDANRRLSSSTTHKAVYINKPGQRRPDSRSSFNIIPPAFVDSDAIERSDGVFKQTNPTAGRAQVPIIPDHALSSANNDIPEDELRDALQIRPDAPLIAILSPRPCHEVWAACSALANTSGGYLILGLRRYEKAGIVSYYPKSVQNPEDAIKNIYKLFNDRNIISDCPKDPSFITASQIRNKNIIVMHIDPAQFAPAPLYTTRDSFGMKTNQGCYLLIEGKIVHCTQDDVKNLWQQKRLGNDIPDWSQTSDRADIEMRRKISIHLRPLSMTPCARFPAKRSIAANPQNNRNFKSMFPSNARPKICTKASGCLPQAAMPPQRPKIMRTSPGIKITAISSNAIPSLPPGQMPKKCCNRRFLKI